MHFVSGFISADNTLLMRAVLRAVSLYSREMQDSGWLQYESRIIYGLRHGLVQRFVAFKHDKEIVSFLAFEQHDLSLNIEIIGAWTHSDYRRNGLYDALFQKLVKLYSTKKYRKISSGFHYTNQASKQMQEKQGRIIGPLRDNGFHSSEFFLKETHYE